LIPQIKLEPPEAKLNFQYQDFQFCTLKESIPNRVTTELEKISKKYREEESQRMETIDAEMLKRRQMSLRQFVDAQGDCHESAIQYLAKLKERIQYANSRLKEEVEANAELEAEKAVTRREIEALKIKNHQQHQEVQRHQMIQTQTKEKDALKRAQLEEQVEFYRTECLKKYNAQIFGRLTSLGIDEERAKTAALLFRHNGSSLAHDWVKDPRNPSTLDMEVLLEGIKLRAEYIRMNQ